jgi:hypothetical protein
MINFVSVSVNNDNQIAQTITVGQLTENHTKQLVPAGKMPYILIAGIPGNKFIEYPLWQKTY